MSWQVRPIDLSASAVTIAGNGQNTYVVFWWGSLPLGAQAYLAEELPLRAGHLIPLASRLVARQLTARLPRFGAPLEAEGDGRVPSTVDLDSARQFDAAGLIDELSQPAKDLPNNLSVVVCTRDRPQDLECCVRALLAQPLAAAELVVVDNSANGSARAVCQQFPGVRWVHEPRPGLSVARNTGLRSSRGDIVAFTDDDVQVHPNWCAEVAHVFAKCPDIDAVSGLVLPASLESAPQRFFQFEMGGFGETHVPLVFGPTFFSDQLPHAPQVWRVGAGANMAFRRRIFDRVGLFDERLGAGASGCSEDSELWYRILAAGGHCLYEPKAVVFHHHRATWRGLFMQMRAYMHGHVSALIVQHDRHQHAANLRRIWWQLPRYFASTALQVVRQGSWIRGRVLMEEVLGWGQGLTYFARPAWRRANGGIGAGRR
jgi:GT2 family glycosyltransferase